MEEREKLKALTKNRTDVKIIKFGYQSFSYATPSFNFTIPQSEDLANIPFHRSPAVENTRSQIGPA